MICMGLVAQEVTNPVESSFTCPGACPGSSQVLCPLLLSCSHKSVPRVYYCPTAEAGWSLLRAVVFAKPVVPSLAHWEINLHTQCLPSCPLTAAYFSPPFCPPILTVSFAKENYPSWELEENGVKGAKISQGRFFRADPPLGPISVRRACSTQLHHAVRKRDLKSNPHMQLFLLLLWIENPRQGRRVNPILGGQLCQPCRQPVLQQGAESSIPSGSDFCKTCMYSTQILVFGMTHQARRCKLSKDPGRS